MDTNEKAELRIRRDYKVVKANNIIQRARYDLFLPSFQTVIRTFSPNTIHEAQGNPSN